MKKLLFLLWILLVPLLLNAQQTNSASNNQEVRYVRSRSIKVYEQPDMGSNTVGDLSYLTEIRIVPAETEERENGAWVKIVSPIQGYIFQKRLIKRQSMPESVEKSEKKPEEKIEDKSEKKPEEKPEEKSMEEPSAIETQQPVATTKDRGNLWVGLGLSLHTIPEESGYTSSVGESFDLFLYSMDPHSVLSKFRFGINFTKAKNNDFETSTKSLYGVYKLQAKPVRRTAFEFYALGGVALMISDIAKGTSGTDSGLGLIVGAGVYLENDLLGLPENLKSGAQIIYLSRQAELGGVKKYVGSSQLQFLISANF
ncbi:MAG: hypothetical protein HQ517_08445 [SAR324 cluster bacterium]|nr:hypothetical protein [SAR324 cluster bacterium]